MVSNMPPGYDEDGGAEDTDHLIGAGWWPSEQVEELQVQVKALRNEMFYEDGLMKNGVSVKFLARISLLTHAAGLDVPPDILAEAQRLLPDQQ